MTIADGNRWLAKTQTELDSGRWIDPKAGKETLQVYAERWVETRLTQRGPSERLWAVKSFDS